MNKLEKYSNKYNLKINEIEELTALKDQMTKINKLDSDGAICNTKNGIELILLAIYELEKLEEISRNLRYKLKNKIK